MMFLCLVFLAASALAELNDSICYEGYSCPGKGQEFDSDAVIDYFRDETGSQWKMKVHSDYFDQFCPFYARYKECTKQYEPYCDKRSKAIFLTIRSTYEMICINHKSDIESLIEPCFNDLIYQGQLVDICYTTWAEQMMTETDEDGDSCRIVNDWTNCTLHVLAKCNPMKAHIFADVVETAKPYICQIQIKN